VCLENHTQTLIKDTFTVEVCIEHSINMPACGEEVQVKLKDCVSTLGPDGIFFNSTVGFLHVVTYDPLTQIVALRNLCEECSTVVQKSPGELIAADTCFYVGPAQCLITGTGGTTLQPFLACDFVVPEVSSCTLIKVTTVNGISVGAVIAINTFQFRVAQVLDAVTIDICNDGDGGTPGMAIKADANNDGVLDHPIIIVSLEDPCAQDPVVEGLPVVCDNGIRKPIKGDTTGQILVFDQVKDLFTLKLVDFDALVCTTFVGCLTLNPAQVDQEYPITVTDSTGFVVGDVVFFNCDTQERNFIIVSITNNDWVITPSPEVLPITEVEVIADDCEGCKLVRRECCFRLENIIDCLKTQIVSTAIGRDGEAGAPASPPLDIPNAALFENDSTQQLWADNTGGVTTGDVVLANIPSFQVTNNSVWDAIVDIISSMAVTVARLNAGGGYDLQVLISITGFAGTDFTQLVPTVDVLAAISHSFRNDSMGNHDLGLRVETIGQSSGSIDVPLLAGNSVTIHYLGRILNRLIGGAPDRINNMPVTLKTIVYPQCDGSIC